MNKNLATILAAGFVTLAVACLTACGGKPTPPPAEPAPAQTEVQPPVAHEPSAPPLASGRENEPLPPGHPPINPSAPAGGMGAPSIVPPPPGSGEGEAGVTWTTPAGWIEEKPSSSMRKAQYKVPGPGGDGELVVFYFGPGQGGAPQANAERWAGQFLLPDGSPAVSAMKTATTKVGDMDVLTVEVAGTYTGGMTMSMEPAKPKPGYMLLGAVAEGADSNWFFKLTGPEATVKAQRGAFESLVKSLKRGA